MHRALRFVIVSAVVLAAGVASAEQAYYAVPLPGLELVDGQLPRQAVDATSRRQWQNRMDQFPRVVVYGDAEAYLTYRNGSYSPWIDPSDLFAGMTVHARAPKGKDVKGRLFLPQSDQRKMVQLRFVIPSGAADPAAEKRFYEAKESHYRELRTREIPGGAWFRHEELAARRQQAIPGAGRPEDPLALPAQNADQWSRRDEVSQTFELFTGGRAVSENLQLDRLLPPAGEKIEKVPLGSIRGITVEEMDWSKLTAGLDPQVDPLAKYVPADQHAVFFPTLAAAVRVADEARSQGTPILRMLEPRAEDARTQSRYERQLGCSLVMAKITLQLSGTHLIKSVALTGSDPYYRTGTDVAVLLETDRPQALAKLLNAQVNAMAAASKAQRTSGRIGGLAYTAVRSPDRTICSYVAELDDAVVLANSPYQLQRMAEVRAGGSPAIAASHEYRFFRGRYLRGEKRETALLVITDATIRRWCGPRWRIGASRRLLAAAMLAEVQASQIDALVDGRSARGTIHTQMPLGEDGRLTLTQSGVVSPVEGSLAFLTPIAEMPMTEVTKGEAEAYERWRDGYERYWNVGFDPIAFRITVDDRQLAGDLTVMPLISATRYQELIDITAGGKMQPRAGDPHDALAQLVLAVNTKSQHFRSAENLASSMKAGLGFGWIGDAVSVYVDQSPFWEELAAQADEEEKFEEFMERNFHRVPVGLHAEVVNGFQLTAFLASGRAWLEQTSPGMLKWDTIERDGETYVKVSPTEKARSREREMPEWAVYYAASGDGLTVSLDEDVLRRALARQKERRAAGGADSAGKATSPEPRPWLGRNVALRVDRGMLAVINGASAGQYRRALQRESWNNLPILNEWRRRWPEADPVELHDRVWGIRLVCPGGGRYVWNPQWHTMESTVFGHPGEPKQGPVVPPLLGQFHAADFGLSFENNGLRAQVELDREEASAHETPTAAPKSPNP